MSPLGSHTALPSLGDWRVELVVGTELNGLVVQVVIMPLELLISHPVHHTMPQSV